MRVVRAFLCALVVGLVAQPVAAAPITLDFEDLFEFDGVGTQYPGVNFLNAVVLTAGSALNEIDFPPASGVNVAALDSRGTVDLLFDAPILSFSAFFTYVDGLLVEAFDAGGTLIDDASSAHASNIATGPNPPNESIAVAGAGIRRIRISGADFVFDDVTYDTAQVVPEPASLGLLLAGALAAAFRRRA